MFINFKKLPKSDILFLDNNLLNIRIKNISSIVYNFNEIRFYYLIRAIYNFIFKRNKLSFKQIYKKQIYEAISPKVAISEYINQRSFEFKHLMPETKVITYQFSFINKKDFFSKKYKYKKTDYFFVFSDLERKFLKKFFQTKFIISGSCISNSINKNQKIIYDICYISEFNSKKKFKKKYQQRERNHNENQKIIVQNISEYCKQNKKKFIIALRSNRKDKNNIDYETEVDYYKKLIFSNFKYKKNNSYLIADQSRLIICLSSALGIEMLGRNKKVLFLPFDQMLQKKTKNPYFKFNGNKYYSIRNNPKKIKQMIDKFLHLSDNQWKKHKEKNFHEIHYDYQNNQLNKKILEIIDEGK